MPPKASIYIPNVYIYSSELLVYSCFGELVSYEADSRGEIRKRNGEQGTEYSLLPPRYFALCINKARKVVVKEVNMRRPECEP